MRAWWALLETSVSGTSEDESEAGNGPERLKRSGPALARAAELGRGQYGNRSMASMVHRPRSSGTGKTNVPQALGGRRRRLARLRRGAALLAREFFASWCRAPPIGEDASAQIVTLVKAEFRRRAAYRASVQARPGSTLPRMVVRSSSRVIAWNVLRAEDEIASSLPRAGSVESADAQFGYCWSTRYAISAAVVVEALSLRHAVWRSASLKELRSLLAGTTQRSGSLACIGLRDQCRVGPPRRPRPERRSTSCFQLAKFATPAFRSSSASNHM